MHSLINQILNIEIQLRDVLSEYSLLRQDLFDTIDKLQDITLERDLLKLERDSLAERIEYLGRETA